MISHSAPACACCGAPTPDDKRIDVRFGLLDAAFGGAESGDTTGRSGFADWVRHGAAG